MADATRVINLMATQLAETLKQLIVAQVELQELREKLAATEKNDTEEK